MAEWLKFTDRAIAALAPPSNGVRAEYADTEADGLRLRITSSGVRTFSVLRRIRNGPMERITLGRFPDAYKTESARTRARILSGLIANGANPAEVRRANKVEPSFAEFFAEYMQLHSKPNKRTWSEDAQKYRDYLARPLGRIKLSQVTREDLTAIHLAITRSGHPTVANRVKDLVSSVFGKAVAWNYLDKNPATGIEDNVERSRKRFLMPSELPRVFRALEEEPNPAFRDYFFLALLTGARRHNLRSMRWGDVDLERSEWVIPKTKNDEPLHVPLVPDAVGILTERRVAAAKNAEYVFPASRPDSKHGHMSGERKAWLRLLDRDEAIQLRDRLKASGIEVEMDSSTSLLRTLVQLRALAAEHNISMEGARLDDVRIHDLRRTLGSWQARTGASLLVIGKTLGHKSQQATTIYARLDLDPVRTAIEHATSAMLDAAKSRPTA